MRPDQLGTLLDDTRPVELSWLLEALIPCAAKVLARCADGELYFVGRSLDSVHDLLSGALSGTSWLDRVHLVPVSLWNENGFTQVETNQLRANLDAAGLSPRRLARGSRPVVFVDVVAEGGTFGHLFRIAREWCWTSGRRGT